MGYSKHKKLSKAILDSLEFDSQVTKYFLEAVDVCVKKEIAIVDINLTKHIYPVLEKKFGKTPGAIETECIKAIAKSWKDVDTKIFMEELGYSSRPTIKKIIVLLLTKLKYEV